MVDFILYLFTSALIDLDEHFLGQDLKISTKEDLDYYPKDKLAKE